MTAEEDRRFGFEGDSSATTPAPRGYKQEVTKRMIWRRSRWPGSSSAIYLTLYKLNVIGELSCRIGSCETVNASVGQCSSASRRGLGLRSTSTSSSSRCCTTARFEYEPVISVVLVAQAAIGSFIAWLTYLEMGVIHASAFGALRQLTF